jgi:hypothetical protein
MSGPDTVITGDSLIARSADLMSADLDQDTVLMSLERGSYFALAETGREIWRRLAEPVRAADLCRTMCELYDGPSDRIEADTLAFLARLAQLGLIDVR